MDSPLNKRFIEGNSIQYGVIIIVVKSISRSLHLAPHSTPARWKSGEGVFLQVLLHPCRVVLLSVSGK